MRRRISHTLLEVVRYERLGRRESMLMKRPMTVAVTLILILTLAHPGGNTVNAHAESRNRPVLFIHGFDWQGVPGERCTAPATDPKPGIWGWMTPTLGNMGWDTTKFRYISYYYGDSGCSDHGPDENTIEHHGNHADGPHHGHDGIAAHGISDSGHEKDNLGKWSHNTSAYIQHLGYHFAWYIWDHYSSQGVTVDIVAHSMGGLITGYMLAKVQQNKGDTSAQRPIKDFPGYLYVEDVATMGTPHSGTDRTCWVGNPQQAEQMCFSDRDILLDWMGDTNYPGGARALDPQGRGGTDWTLIGSFHDQNVPVKSTTGVPFLDRSNLWRTPRHWERAGVADTAIVRLNHTQYREDQSLAADRDERHQNRGQSVTHWTTGPHNIKWVDNALFKLNW